MTEHHILAHGRTAQVEIAILEAQGFVNLNSIGNREWSRTRRIQYFNMLSDYLNISGREVWVLCSRQASHNGAPDLYHIL